MLPSLHWAFLWSICKHAHSPDVGLSSGRQQATGRLQEQHHTNSNCTSTLTATSQGTNTEQRQGQAHLLTDLFLLHLQLL